MGCIQEKIEKADQDISLALCDLPDYPHRNSYFPETSNVLKKYKGSLWHQNKGYKRPEHNSGSGYCRDFFHLVRLPCLPLSSIIAATSPSKVMKPILHFVYHTFDRD